MLLEDEAIVLKATPSFHEMVSFCAKQKEMEKKALSLNHQVSPAMM